METAVYKNFEEDGSETSGREGQKIIKENLLIKEEVPKVPQNRKYNNR